MVKTDKTLTPNTAPLVRIDWEDILFNDNWGDEDEPVHPKEIWTVGYLLVDSPSEIVIGSSYDWPSGQWGTVHAISKKVPEIVVLAEGESDA